MSLFKKAAAAVACALLLASPGALAATYDIDVTGIDSVAGFGDPGNEILTINLADALGFASGTALTITGIGWDVVIESFDPSWISEITAGFQNSDNSDFIDLSPGAGSDFPDGPTAFSSGGILDLASIDPEFPIDLFDGVLVIEFFEGFDDASVAIDGAWVSGFLTVDAVEAAPIPVPAALPLLLSALAFFGLIGRRRA